MCDEISVNSYRLIFFFFFSRRRRHTRFKCDWSSDVCSSDLSHVEGDTHATINYKCYRRSSMHGLDDLLSSARRSARTASDTEHLRPEARPNGCRDPEGAKDSGQLRS